jgi:threonylcarbamoyladenosine tRNA methylthiotransferase CDKAL1
LANLIAAGKAAQKALLVTGCVPQGDRKASELAGLSLLGVGQIDRVVEAAEATLRGQQMVLLGRNRLPALDLPKVREGMLCVDVVIARQGHAEEDQLQAGIAGSRE